MGDDITEIFNDKDITEEFLRAIHPVPAHQDSRCPFIEWMGEDLTHCLGVGEWKCKLQEYKYGDLLYGGWDENTDYRACNCSEHRACYIYFSHQQKKSAD